MTLDQYLGTVAWLWIAVIIYAVAQNAVDTFRQMNYHKSNCQCWRCVDDKEFQIGKPKIDTSADWILPFACLLVIGGVIEFLVKFRMKNYYNFNLKRVLVTSSLSVFAYPLYLWVSTSFAFNITYIGG